MNMLTETCSFVILSNNVIGKQQTKLKLLKGDHMLSAAHTRAHVQMG